MVIRLVMQLFFECYCSRIIRLYVRVSSPVWLDVQLMNYLSKAIVRISLVLMFAFVFSLSCFGLMCNYSSKAFDVSLFNLLSFSAVSPLEIFQLFRLGRNHLHK